MQQTSKISTSLANQIMSERRELENCSSINFTYIKKRVRHQRLIEAGENGEDSFFRFSILSQVAK
tara:strand:+ start:252 stop:446 length:195 start_codon:yes stop_codon:yes gene_type:complete